MKLLGVFKRGKKLDLPAFGGDVRPPIKGPKRIQRDLNVLSFVRIMIASAITVVGLIVIALAIRTPQIMGTELFISDGSALGCHVRAHLVGGQ